MTERQELFWKQYNGEVKAIDLPQWYIEEDTRIYCCNEQCFCREKCELFARYVQGCKVFGRIVERGCVEDSKGKKRNPWEKIKGLNYGLASFGMLPAQEGAKPCEHFMKKG